MKNSYCVWVLESTPAQVTQEGYGTRLEMVASKAIGTVTERSVK
ncbi:MAG: hypothetical protein ACRCZS_03970 [Chroococcidiopsis sp.]